MGSGMSISQVRELTAESLTAETPLMEAGIDSLAATELSNQLRDATGLTLSPTLVFEQPTPRAIAAHVLEELLGSQPAVAAPMAAAGGARAEVAVGVSGATGRWPGGCTGAGVALWSMLEASGDAVGEVPATRWVLEEAVDEGLELRKAAVSRCSSARPASSTPLCCCSSSSGRSRGAASRTTSGWGPRGKQVSGMELLSVISLLPI